MSKAVLIILLKWLLVEIDLRYFLSSYYLACCKVYDSGLNCVLPCMLLSIVTAYYHD